MTVNFASRGFACLLSIACLFNAVAAEEAPGPALSAHQIAALLVSRNQERAEALKNYTGTRNYHLVYTGFPARKEAELVVEARFDAPNAKTFTIVSQSGSSFIVNRVLKRLLESEKEASTEEQRARTALSEQNYEFELLGYETIAQRPAYILQVTPKIDNKFLYRGKIWVDAGDFAVVKIEAEPAKRPSFWISKTRIKHSYTKVGDFWLPTENRSTTDVRLGGVATLTISYTNYQVNRDAELSRQGNTPQP
jgi:outer membrane lipoprotein-sorting protein